jgi:hypothetical protein
MWQVCKGGQGIQERHDSGVAHRQSWDPLTVVGDGRLHKPLQALARQGAGEADVLSVLETLIDLSAQFLEKG